MPSTLLSARVSRRPFASLLGLAVALFVTHPARAAGPDTATAESLFEQGRELLRAGNLAEACPKLEESLRLDPATGSLLAVAMCHEAQGKLASAWAEFAEVEAASRSEGRTDREQGARERGLALRPRLSTLEVRVPVAVASLPGLEVRRDGVVMGRGAWNVAVAVDGGTHTVDVSAPGKRPWSGNAVVKTEQDSQVLLVPALEQAAAPPVTTPADAPSSAPTAGPSPAATPAARTGEWRTLEWSGVGVAAAGVVTLGVGGYFLAHALGQNSDSKSDCDASGCGPAGYESRHSAVKSGQVATGLGIAGGVLLAGGATLFVLGRTTSPSSERPTAAVALGFGPGGPGAQLLGRF